MILRYAIHKVAGSNILVGLFLLLIPISMNAQRFSKHQWEKRVLLIFSPGQNTPKFKQQIKALGNESAALKERDLVVYTIFTNEGFGPQSKQLSQDMIDNLRTNWEVKPDQFKLILIGKDSYSKLVNTTFTKPNTIFDLIDSMPMRRAEIRGKH